MSQDIKFLTADNLTNVAIFHGFFTREQGVSTGLYEGLNCGLGSADKKENITENRHRVAVKARVKPSNLLSVYQVHGSRVITVEHPWSEENRPQADALVCDKFGIALSILTADCAPVLFLGQKDGGGPVIGAAHAGWQGAIKGVMEATLEAMKELGVKEESLCASIGPCIAQDSYEVSNDFILPFIEEDKTAQNFFKSGRNSNYAYFDLSGYCAWRLMRYGLRNVSVCDVDTYKNEKKFYSYRRATHRNEEGYGRQISVITIL